MDKIARALRSVGDNYLRENPADLAALREALDRKRRHKRLAWGTSAVTVAAVAAVAFVIFVKAPESGSPPVAEGDRLSVTNEVNLGTLGQEVTSEGSDAWVTERDDNAVVKLSTGTNAIVDRIELPGSPQDVLKGPSGIWVSIPARGSLVNIDPVSGAVEEIPLTGFTGPTRLHVGERAVRVVVDQGVVILPIGGEPSLLYEGAVVDTAMGNNAFWILRSDGAIVPIDPDTGVPVDGIADLSYPPGGIEITFLREALWYAPSGGTQLVRIDEATGREINRLSLPGEYKDIDAGEQGLWVLIRRELGGSLHQISPDGLSLIQSNYSLDSAPNDLSANDLGIWVVLSDGRVIHLDD